MAAFKVLIVEDVKMLRTMLEHQLRELGVDLIVTAADGTEALTVLTRELDVDLIISDWHMEPMDGLDFCARMQALPHIRGRQIPVLFMTSDERLADPDKRRRTLEPARSLGIVDMLAKPVEIDELREAMIRCSGPAAALLSQS